MWLRKFAVQEGDNSENNQGGQGGGSAGGGGDGGGQPPPPSLADAFKAIQQLQQTIATQQQRQEQVLASVAQAAEAEKARLAAAQSQQGNQDQAYIDPSVQQLIDQRVSQVVGHVVQTQDQVDQLSFHQTAMSEGIDAETRQQVENIFQHWKKTNAIPGASRVDALNMLLGAKSRTAAMTDKQKKAAEEATRRAQNAQAFVETPRGGRRESVTNSPDYDKMSPAERVAKFWPSKLDDQEF